MLDAPEPADADRPAWHAAAIGQASPRSAGVSTRDAPADAPGERATGGSFDGHRLREDATGEVFLIERSATWRFATFTTGAAFIARHGVPGYQVPFEAISLHVPDGEKGWTLLPPLPGGDDRPEETDRVGRRHP